MAGESVIIATLLHRPPHPLPAGTASCLDEKTVAGLVDAVAAAAAASTSTSGSGSLAAEEEEEGGGGNKSTEQSRTTTTTICKSWRALDSESHPHVLEARLTVAAAVDVGRLRGQPALAAFEQRQSLEVVLQTGAGFGARAGAGGDGDGDGARRLAVFDMDSTLIEQEVIELLAGQAGAGAAERVAGITARAMNGELDFAGSLRERVGVLGGVPAAAAVEAARGQITLAAGAETVVRVLKRRGWRTALLSGGFGPLARWLAARLGIEHVHANELEVGADGALTGRLRAGCEMVDAARKAALLREIAGHEGIADDDLSRVIAVGDGANDLPMLHAAGLGVAVNAKPRVQAEAPARLNGKTALLDVLHLLGLTSSEIDQLDTAV